MARIEPDPVVESRQPRVAAPERIGGTRGARRRHIGSQRLFSTERMMRSDCRWDSLILAAMAPGGSGPCRFALTMSITSFAFCPYTCSVPFRIPPIRFPAKACRLPGKILRYPANVTR